MTSDLVVRPEQRAAVAALIASMTIEEKIAQLVGVWVRLSPDALAGGGSVAPMQDENTGELPPLPEVSKYGLGQLTRVFGTAPIEPELGVRLTREFQHDMLGRIRHPIAAVVHEECLVGVMAWKATTYPTPVLWGCSWDEDLVFQLGSRIGQRLRDLGVHQGLAPVLDVVRDQRWGRVEECVGEDPYLVGVLGSAYVAGIEQAGVVATLKHMVGYSASQAGRNLAPVHMGRRELEDVMLPPFEMAVREGGARSVMHSYTEIDGMPIAATPAYLTDILRTRWGFTGTVVSDYFAVGFLHTAHHVAADLAAAAMLALTAGIDVELPSLRAFPLLADRVCAGEFDEAFIDRALERVLRQKDDLGLIGHDGVGPNIGELSDPVSPIDLDPVEDRDLARLVAQRSMVLLHNNGVLPLQQPAKIAVVGPNADRAQAMLGAYSFRNHHEGLIAGLGEKSAAFPTVLDAIRHEFPNSIVSYAQGCRIREQTTEGFAEAVAVAQDADVCVVAVGDISSLFGRGTVGEGCDAADLELPGSQRQLIEALLATGTPVVIVLLTGRPYGLEWAVDRAAAIVAAFLPGQEGGPALSSVLSGAVCPSGKLSVSFSRTDGPFPMTYRHPWLGGPTSVSSQSTVPVFAFGHGLSYTTFEYSDFRLSMPHVSTDGSFEAEVTIRNTGHRQGDEVVQLYAHDVYGSVTRPLKELLGFGRVSLEPGEAVIVHWKIHTDRLSFTGPNYQRIVEAGDVEMYVGAASDDLRAQLTLTLTGPTRMVGEGRVLRTPWSIRPCPIH